MPWNPPPRGFLRRGRSSRESSGGFCIARATPPLHLLLLGGAQRQPGRDEETQEDEAGAVEERPAIAVGRRDAAKAGHLVARRRRQPVEQPAGAEGEARGVLADRLLDCRLG